MKMAAKKTAPFEPSLVFDTKVEAILRWSEATWDSVKVFVDNDGYLIIDGGGADGQVGLPVKYVHLFLDAIQRVAGER
jgi:hypothetical protein